MFALLRGECFPAAGEKGEEKNAFNCFNTIDVDGSRPKSRQAPQSFSMKLYESLDSKLWVCFLPI